MGGAGVTIQLLHGDRLHLHHGPIDVVLKAQGRPGDVEAAYRAAATRFPAILPELCAELPALRGATGSAPRPASAVGRRMEAACRPFAGVFITPMAAVAGAVADELLSVMLEAAPLDRAYVNDGGDIAVWCAPGQSLTLGIAGWDTGGDSAVPGRTGKRCLTEPARPGALPATLTVASGDGVGGVATSGARGRSFSLGIADAVTILAANAAAADAAATLVANAVDLDHPGIVRCPAADLDPDSDLGRRLVTVDVPPLPPALAGEALERGVAAAAQFRDRGLILDAALALQGQVRVLGSRFAPRPRLPAARTRIPEGALP